MTIELMRQALVESHPGAQVFEDLGDGYPLALVLDARKGAVAVAVCGQLDDLKESQKLVKAQFRSLVEDFESGKNLPRSEIVIREPFLGEYFLKQFDDIPDQDVDPVAIRDFVDEFRPTMSFQAVVHRIDPDDGRFDRENKRFNLDKAQEEVAKNPPGELSVLTGPAGSGKSLVLLARARLIAREHPQWKINIVCFNRGLVPYLAANVEGLPNVRVGTFSSWAWENGYRLNMNSCESSWVGFEKAQRSGIYQNTDLLLVDEFQDFCSAWIALLLKSLVPNRGGAILAGDHQQNLYRDSNLDEVFRGANVEHLELRVPYRSTRQILEIVKILDPAQTIPGMELAPNGSPVEIIWTESPLPTKAEAVAHICKQLLSRGLLKGDIGVLVTTKYMIGTITAVLNQLGVKAEARYANKIEPDDPVWSSSVKVMTVHSAKGLDFPAVILVGIDELKSPDQAHDATERLSIERRARLNLVGPTRAKDSLFVIAARDNSYIKRVKERAADLVMHHWPEDFGEVNGG